MHEQSDTFSSQVPPIERGHMPSASNRRRNTIVAAISVPVILIVGAVVGVFGFAFLLWLWLFVSLMPRPWVATPNTPLPAIIAAAESGDVELIKTLHQQGEPINGQAFNNARWPDGISALMIAVHRNDRAVTKLLLELGADVSLKCASGDSAIHMAAPDTLQSLLDHGADINARTSFNQTPLMVAAVRARDTKDLTMVRMLLEAGADVNAKDAYGRTAIGVLQTWPDLDPEVIRLLQQAGGR